MLLPIKNMSYLPTIRFKDPISSHPFKLSLQYPYKVNGTLLTKFNYNNRYGGERIYYVMNEIGGRFNLPDNFKYVIHNAINIHNNVYGTNIQDDEDFIIRSIECQSRDCMHPSGIDVGNEILRTYHRFNRTDLYDCILYDSITNECFIYNSDGEVVCETHNMGLPAQRGRRAELNHSLEGYIDIEQIANGLPNYGYLTTTATTNRSESHSTIQQTSECLREIHSQSITFPSAAYRSDENLENMNLTATASNDRSELDARERTVHAYDGYRHHGFSTGRSVNESISDREYYHDFYDMKVRKTYIHSFNYVPEYIKHFMPGESEDTTLLLGAEIEVGGNNNISSDNDKNSTVKKCIQIMNGSDSDAEDLIYSTHDSTVQIEFDTMPCSLEFHKNKMNYREMFEYLDKEGYKGHDCKTAGLHIHANRNYLGKSRISQELVISKILYILEKFNDEICVIARRDNEYSEFVGSKKEENSIIELYGKYKDHGKRAALNLQHKDTIEFRMFKSTLKYETFILTLEFVKDIIDFAKSASIEEIELVKWADLMKLFSPALRNYYTERYNKQYKKTMNEDETLLKRQISNIKKAILNCKNYMMKTKLQQEYDELRRQYNKIHKKNKRKKAYPTVTHVDSRIDGLTSAGAYSQSGELIYRFDNMRNLNLTAI